MTNTPAKITIREVAAQAGVSVMTVSRVLRNEPHVTEDKRAAVFAAIKSLNYVPLHSARNLASSVPKVIGLLVPHQGDDLFNQAGYEYLSALHLGALSVCLDHNYALMMVQGHHARTAAQELTAQVRARQIGGYVIPAPATEMPGLMKTLAGNNVPFTAISPLRFEHASMWVAADERPAARAMTEHLISLGHRLIAFAGGGLVRAGVERLAGFREAMAAAGLAVKDRYICGHGMTFDDGMEAGRRLLGPKGRPTAVVCATDDVAAGVIAAGHERKLMLPDELSVVGFDNSGLSRKTWPQLSTINLPIEAMAAQAVRQLISALQPGGEPADATTLLSCELHLRASVAPPG